MATLNLSQNGRPGNARSRKAVPAVDLTAMVDLAFLLITFFMLTTSLSRPLAMDLAKPVIDIPDQPYPASRTVTLILGKENQVVWYRGEPGKSTAVQSNFEGINQVLAENKKAIAEIHSNDPAKFMVVIIKPTAASSYKNFVDALDEMNIAAVKSFLVDDDSLLEPELASLKSLGLL
ncbi:biopolymer transporter ExbD [Pedobacter sp. PLR]|uniref:ExbD/TolR family protein n=1 Tax=Pedobacter sp. PLR TaxID=2994465 RepID=UPI002246EFAC|nr:biopolymer transporter ExbD [Pedobacter sp. PLR]MCX2452731.1 biopolymer transporter ExbD [Pedobacter sp. PLR]